MRLEELPATKTCNRCGRTRPKDKFGIRRQYLKDGSPSYYLESHCRRCVNERTSKYYHEVIKPSKDERPKESRGDLEIDGAPVVQYVLEHGIPQYIPDNVRKRLNDLREGRAKRVGIDIVDTYFVMMHVPWKLNELYPLDSE